MGDASFTSHLEGMALRDAEVEGGFGYAEATVVDLGLLEEIADGAVGSGEPVKKKRGRKSKIICSGRSLVLAEITNPRGDQKLSATLEKTSPSSSKDACNKNQS